MAQPPVEGRPALQRLRGAGFTDTAQIILDAELEETLSEKLCETIYREHVWQSKGEHSQTTGKKMPHRALSKRTSHHDVTETSSSYDDEISLWEADSKPEESPEQQLQLIKARTMYQMIEDVPGDGASAKRRVMFLTNAQAELIAMQPEAKGIRQLLQALEIPQPKLVINVLPSWGFSEYSAAGPPWESAAKDSIMGMVFGRSPFATHEHEASARARIDTFMMDVLIPIAAKTSAVVVCEATSQWGGALPFTILSITSATAFLYCNPDVSAEWRRVRRGCRAWRERDKMLNEIVHEKWGQHRLGKDWVVLEKEPAANQGSRVTDEPLRKALQEELHKKTKKQSGTKRIAEVSLTQEQFDELPEVDLDGNSYIELSPVEGSRMYFKPKPPKVQVGKWKLDLDANADLLLIVDGINERKRLIHQRGPQAQLVGEIMRFLGSSIPSICFQTGMTKRVTFETADDASSDLGEAYKITKTGSSVVFLDVRERFNDNRIILDSTRHLNRSAIINEARQDFIRSSDELFGKQLADTFDTCAIAFFRDALLGDGDVYTTEAGFQKRSGTRKPQPLHEAISLVDDHEQNSLPLKWKAGPAPTDSNRGKEIKKEALAKALLEKQADSLQEFSAQEIQEWFSAKELAELSSESYICAGNKYFYALVSDAFQPASEKQVADTADWLAKRIVYSAWRILPADLRTKMIAKVDAEQEHAYSQDPSRVKWVELGHDEPEDGKDVTEKMKTIVDGMQGADETEKMLKIINGMGAMKEVRIEKMEEAFGCSFDQSYVKVGNKYYQPHDEIYQLVWKDRIAPLSTYMRLLMMSPNFHHLNLIDSKGSKVLIEQLVQMDRIPSTNPLSGLKLLRQAWTEYDVVVHFAQYYKWCSKVLYVLQLLLAWLIIVCTSLRSVVCESRPDLAKDSCESAFQQGIFVTSLMASFLLFLDNLLFSTKRWRQLRSGAGSLESLIWLYRARTGPFGQPSGSSGQSAEDILQEKLDQWMDDLISGADLSRTSLRRFKQTSKANKIYRHFQYEGALPSEANDDHQTPVRPDDYIKLRLEPMMEFYQSRLPKYNQMGMIMLTALGLLAGSASALSYFGYANFVVVVTSAGTAITSYLEYSNTQRKLERYTIAVNSIIKLINWWSTIDSVERAGAPAISKLVVGGEAIIGEERLAWHPLSVGYDSGNAAQVQDAKAQPDIEKGIRSAPQSNKVHPSPLV